MNKEKIVERLLSIRFFEESLDEMFSKGIIAGTYHRCIGQEATSVGVTSNLSVVDDYVVSNHRNHGHYLGFTEDYSGLMREIMGDNEGVTSGRGGSQVIFGEHFLSTGILGPTVGIAAGIGLGLKKRGSSSCVVCFMGDGVLGEGIVYESLNMISLWSLPVLLVLEKNNVAQSTDIEAITSGSLVSRFESFGIPTESIKSTDVFKIIDKSNEKISKIRNDSRPFALVVEAERLCAHSKGDDSRSEDSLMSIRKQDPILILKDYTNQFDEIEKSAKEKIKKMIGDIVC